MEEIIVTVDYETEEWTFQIGGSEDEFTEFQP